MSENSVPTAEAPVKNVHITVSSIKSHIELNWTTDLSSFNPDSIALFDKDPTVLQKDGTKVEPIEKIKVEDHPNGYFKTKIKFTYTRLPGSWDYNQNLLSPALGPHNFSLWIVALQQDIIIDINSLQIQPTWMGDHSAHIGKLRIGNLLVPGTHNSGCYRGSPVMVRDYVLTQDKDVWTQLVFGIRYLDLRVAYYPDDGFCINHDFVKVAQIKPIFKEIKKFVEVSPKEIIILDFHRFPHPKIWTPKMHKDFAFLIEKELGDFAYEYPDEVDDKGPTLNHLWDCGKNLICCYGNINVSSNYHWLWPPVLQFWANTRKVEKLKTFLEKSIERRKKSNFILTAMMSELTAKPIDVFLRKNTIREMAQKVNPELTKWIKHDWKHSCNIVAADYFLGTDIINASIYLNKCHKPDESENSENTQNFQ